MDRADIAREAPRTRYTYTASISFGGDIPTWEGEVTYGFNLQDAEPRTWDDPGSEAAVIDIEVLEIDGERRPWAHFMGDDYLADMMLDKADAFEGEMLASALAEQADDAADAAEYRAEQRAEMAREDCR